MKEFCGWTGKILRIDLDRKKAIFESSEDYVSRFIGGIGVGLKILWDELDPDVGALDADNILVFAPGPLTGTLAPAAGRFELVSRSPRSYPKETITRSGMGGFWGPELKFAGYDALIIQGTSDRWINLWIHNDHVEFRDAQEYLGKDTYSTQAALRKELDPKAKILCIGPAGEKLSRLAVILSETSYACGKSGFGAVMGSKKVKAIAVRGTRPINVFDKNRLIQISRKVCQLSANNPMRDWTARRPNFEEQMQIYRSFINKYRTKNTGCFACPLQCFAYLKIPGAGESQVHCTNYFYYTKATEYYGHSLERDQAVADSYVMANRFGLDTYEIRRMLEFLEDLYKAGKLKEDPYIPFDKIGSREFIGKLYESIAERRGIGDLLAEGSARTADHVDKGWEFCAKHFPAYGSGGHESIRKYPGIALQWALDSRDPIIDQHSYIRLAASLQNQPAPFKLPADQAEFISEKVFGSKRSIDHSTFEDKPQAIIYLQNRCAVINILVVCDWVYPVIQSYTTKDRMGDTSLESQLITAVTGTEFTEQKLDQYGERVWTLARATMIREGRTREDDTFHESYFTKRGGEKGISRIDFEKAKTIYYELRGWDKNTGWPTREKLIQLGLADIANGNKTNRLVKSGKTER
jgi:aldehyde:ferredoxin oxidoreductase